VGGDLPPGVLGSVHHALQALEAVAELGDGVTAKAVARRLGFKLSTTYHLLNTLVADGYLVHLDEAHGYGLGYKLAGLSHKLVEQFDLPQSVPAVVHQVHAEAEAAAYYTVFRDVDIVIAHVSECSRHPRATALDVGYHESAHATAYGKVLLSALTPPQLREYVGATGLRPLTPRTITDQVRLEEEVSRVRAAGLAMDIEEFQPGLAGLAAPARDRTGDVVGAIAVSFPAEEFGSRRWQLDGVVRQGAARVSRALAADQPASP
jgi:DNA-binding IclR family transcriptional regulator